MWPLLVLLGSCGSNGSDALGEPREPAPYLPELGVDAPTPALNSTQVAAAVEQRFAELALAAPLGFPAALETLLANGEPGCPEINDFSAGSLTQFAIRANCTTSQGVSFVGNIDYSFETGRIEDGDAVDGMEFFAQDFRIETPGGAYLTVDGYCSYSHRTNDYAMTAGVYCDGTQLADPTTAGDDPWLTGEVSGFLSSFIGDFSGYQVAVVTASMAVDDPNVVGVSFEDLRWEPGQCDTEMLGSGSIREINGVWHDVVFAVRPEDGDKVVGCDGCGSHLAAGTPQDEPVCNTDALPQLIDFSGGLPW